MKTITITTSSGALRPGDMVSMEVQNPRWWARLLAWVTRRPVLKRQRLRIVQVSGSQAEAEKE